MSLALCPPPERCNHNRDADNARLSTTGFIPCRHTESSAKPQSNRTRTMRIETIKDHDTMQQFQ